MTTYTATATTKSGVTVTVNWSAAMIEKSIDGMVYGEELSSHCESVKITKDGKEVVTGRSRMDLVNSYPDLPAAAAGAMRGTRDGKEIVQPLSQEVYDLVIETIKQAREKSEADFVKEGQDNAEEELIINPAYAHMTTEEIKAAERKYDNIHNEGAEGFNPYRDNLYVKSTQ